jgi:flagellar biosynthesis anti-sigma factor FlgM
MMINRISALANEILTDNIAGKANQSGNARSEQESGAHATLSSSTVAVGSLVAQAMRTPAVRQAKIDDFRASVASGSYPIDTQEIASALIKDPIG